MQIPIQIRIETNIYFKSAETNMKKHEYIYLLWTWHRRGIMAHLHPCSWRRPRHKKAQTRKKITLRHSVEHLEVVSHGQTAGGRQPSSHHRQRWACRRLQRGSRGLLDRRSHLLPLLRRGRILWPYFALLGRAREGGSLPMCAVRAIEVERVAR